MPRRVDVGPNRAYLHYHAGELGPLERFDPPECAWCEEERPDWRCRAPTVLAESDDENASGDHALLLCSDCAQLLDELGDGRLLVDSATWLYYTVIFTPPLEVALFIGSYYPEVHHAFLGAYVGGDDARDFPMLALDDGPLGAESRHALVEDLAEAIVEQARSYCEELAKMDDDDVPADDEDRLCLLGWLQSLAQRVLIVHSERGMILGPTTLQSKPRSGGR